MILATHITVARAVTAPFLGRTNDLIIFLISIASHYLVDSIPHSEYSLSSLSAEEGRLDKLHLEPDTKKILTDILKISADILVGIALLYIFARPELDTNNLITYGLIVIGGILPDALQPLYAIWKKFPFNVTQKMHNFWHHQGEKKFDRKALTAQVAIMALSCSVIYLLK